MISSRFKLVCLSDCVQRHFVSQHTLGLLPLSGLCEVGEEEQPAPPLLTNEEQSAVLLPWLLEDGLQTPAGEHLQTNMRSSETCRIRRDFPL